MQLLPVSKEEKVASLKREIALRRQVYPGRVKDKKMSQARADREIEIMEALLKDVEG